MKKALQEQVDYLTKKLFGSSSEKRSNDIPGQQYLFDEAEVEQDPSLLEMEIKEAMASDWELYERCYYGTEGEDFTYGDDGILIVNADETAEDYTNKGLRHTWAMIPTTIDIMEKSMNERDKMIHSMSLSQPIMYYGRAFAVNGTNKSETIKGEDVNKVVSEYYTNAITGKVDIDSTWDSYVQQVLDAGLDEILAEYEEIRVK